MDSILNNKLFEAFANASENVYIYVSDMKTDITRISANEREYFGFKDEYIKDMMHKWEEKIHPNDREIYIKDITEVYSGKKDNQECQYRVKNIYGDYVWVECRGTMVRDGNGAAKVFAGMMTRLDNQNKYDPLTNLRTIHEFRKYTYTDSNGTILLVGIDGFRKIVNNYGYSFGDSVLAEFACKLMGLCKNEREIFRFQGDEFVIISKGGDIEGTMRFFDKVKRISAMLGQRCGHIVSASVSGGIVSYPKDGSSREELIRNLEHSLEHAKSCHKGSCVVFSMGIAERHNRDILLKEELTKSIQNGFAGFRLYYQPIVDAKNHQITCCEALLRWRTRVITDSYPEEFIPILESNGEIIKVGLWVMEEALKKAKEWNDRFHNIIVSFNVSSEQLRDDYFMEQLLQKTKEYKIDPRYITVELTESCKVEEPEVLAVQFTKLREHGFRIALDDFGIAYSSLGMLRMLPADSVKIDHSFVRELARKENEVDLAIIESVVGLCKRLNMYTIIEGVENSRIEQIVSDFKVSLYQGYYYSMPVTAEEFEKMLQEQTKEKQITEKRITEKQIT